METKIVYVLVSTPQDIYLEQAFISITSLRFHMGNDVTVNVIMDDSTFSGLDEKRKKMLDGADKIITVNVPSSYSPQNRSRILKTSCRKYVDGNFLFVDCDTIITKRLDGIDEINEDIAACYDSHSMFIDNPYRQMCIDHCKKLGVNIESEKTYFNSGVLYVKDSEKTRQFFELWHDNWMKGRLKGINMDQPSFAKTNIELGHIVTRLQDVWNCEYIHGIRFLKDAKIVHYLCTNNTKQKESFLLRNRSVLEEVKKNGTLSSEIEDCFTDPFKGIPGLTTIVAGEAVYFMRTPLYHYLLHHPTSPVYKSLTLFLAAIGKAKNIFKRQKR